MRINTEDESPVRTGGGDDGKSSLMDGVRRPKDDIAFQALGAVDEAQVAIGVCRSLVLGAGGHQYRGMEALDDDLKGIQKELLIAGGILSCSPGDLVPETMPRIDQKSIDALAETFSRWRKAIHIEPRFYISGDTHLGAEFDRARTVVRRAEREVVRLIRERGNTDQIAVSRYLNQLSDLCFVLARWADAQD